ncbi:hypothetical protein [Plebeiibacterium sediminum]|uniref:Uncharacterized protein n=1 Tax=Plebeiibacterium sediminum TaxID=2992112 RepID=A0AAE3M3L0_9BACT|nr:hypothetical protein [Plebeiobacterium sediminum]MCW3786443.1 hypothetical protein [Plebeiobacterium sediminum]
MKHLSILLLVLFSCQLFAETKKADQENKDELTTQNTNITLENLLIYKAKIDSISDASIKTSINTEPTPLSKTDWDEYLNIILALIAAVGTFLTVLVIYLDTKQNSINKTIQEELFKDLIRHFYRNLVVIGVLKHKLQGKYHEIYPSEEHILKFKLLPEDLRVDRFSSSHIHYQQLHKLELQLRNFDIEVDVAMDHFKNKDMDTEVKIRDLKTLEFKCGHLSNLVLEVLEKLKFKFHTLEQAEEFINELSEDGRKEKSKSKKNPKHKKKWDVFLKLFNRIRRLMTKLLSKIKRFLKKKAAPLSDEEKIVIEQRYLQYINTLLVDNNLNIKLLEDDEKYKFYIEMTQKLQYNLCMDILAEKDKIYTISF